MKTSQIKEQRIINLRIKMEKTTIDNSWLDALQGTMQDALKPLFENILMGYKGLYITA